MKRFYILIAAAFMLSVSTSASAQFMTTSGSGNNAVIGAFKTFWLSYAPTNFKVDNISESGANTFSLGITSANPLSGSPFYYEYGAYVDWLNDTEKDSGYTGAVNMIGIKAPLNLMYPFDFADNIILYPYAGIHAKGFIIANASAKYDGEKETINLYDEDSDLKRFALGYQIGIRARFPSFIVGVGYEDLLTSIVDGENSKINSITISLGFPF